MCRRPSHIAQSAFEFEFGFEFDRSQAASHIGPAVHASVSCLRERLAIIAYSRVIIIIASSSIIPSVITISVIVIHVTHVVDGRQMNSS